MTLTVEEARMISAPLYVRDGKLAQAFHIENWMTALEQLRA